MKTKDDFHCKKCGCTDFLEITRGLHDDRERWYICNECGAMYREVDMCWTEDEDEVPF